MDLEKILQLISRHAPAVDFWSARIVFTQNQSLKIRQAVFQAPNSGYDLGVQLTVVHAGGIGYAATSDISQSGLISAFKRAVEIASGTVGQLCFSVDAFPQPGHSGFFESPVTVPWKSRSLNEQMEMLSAASSQLKIHNEIVDWSAWLGYEHKQQIYINSNGSRIEQIFHYIFPGLEAIASRGSLTQVRHGGGAGAGRQGGLEQLDILHFPDEAQSIAEEALQLLDAPECPEGEMDLLLMPEQMILQIHESIGHPLELDRILGDERNYAGSSFVKPDMFGSYKYGSDLLNITFDPTLSGELASYAFDDEGTPAEKTFLIKNGELLQPLGSELSQNRANMEGVANARACNWNRPPIDRMANLNLEPGNTALQEMIGQIELGVMMNHNRSWSIDDHRNKFQFGCEIAWLIKEGEIRHLLRNPNYRGISANFWRHLCAVGEQTLVQAPGVPNCGKGEPNQMVYVGHASPPCLFTNVDVFGGEV